MSVDLEGYGGLHLTEAARPVLRGEQQLMLRKLVKPAKAERKRSTTQFNKDADTRLWNALRTCRKTLAEEQGVPAYVIFHDATLAEMVERQPQTLEQLSRISGIGERKLEAYGDAFLDVILEHSQPAAITDTVDETVQLLCQGNSPLQIAHKRDLTLTTIYKHLSKAIEEGELELDDVVELDEKQLRSIRFAFEQNDSDKLKPVHEALEGEFDYGVLQCVRAALYNQV